jgi:NAD(P)-dependent dehydrogenase (short-subunit alcohol dehydrogenase family)
MNIVVTGTSSGIGFETVKKLTALEVKNIFVISRNKKKLEALQSACRSIDPGTNIICLPVDLTDSSQYPGVLNEIKRHVPHLDVLVNNAGYLVNKRFAEITEEDLDTTISANYKAPFRLSQLLLPLLKKSAGAHIVNISSMGGVQGTSKFKGLSAYSSSKGALSILTECMAEEFKEDNIKVNCLALGAVNTEMLQQAFPGYDAPLSAGQMASFISDFALNGHRVFNGKILPVSLSTP